MSSFQSFKSFIKIEQNHNSNPLEKPNLDSENNQHNYDDISYKQIGMNSAAQSNEKKIQRIKKSGSVCNFITKIYSMLEEKQIQHIVSWNTKEPSISLKYSQSQKDQQSHAQSVTNSFQIFDVLKFQQIILPKYFKHSNMSSFVRQLNMYGFHKLRGDRNNFEFQHQKFQKNRRDLLGQIKRKSPQFIGVSSSFLQDSSIKNISQTMKSNEGNTNSQHRLLNTQKQITSFRQELNESNLYPSQGFIALKKISVQEQIEQENSVEKEKIRKRELIEEENNRLKKIKLCKLQKIKDLNSINKERVQTKFAKVLFSFLTVKLKQEFSKGQVENSLDFQMNGSMGEKTFTINSIVDHILSNCEAETFEGYKLKIEQLLRAQENKVCSG